MKLIKHSITIIFVLFFYSFLNGQYIIPNYQTQKLDKNEWMVRWEPRTLAEWKESLEKGYQIKIYKGKSEKDMVLLKEETIKPASELEWDTAINEIKDTLLVQFYEGAKQLIYSGKALDKELIELLEKEENKSLEQTAEEFRLGYLSYGATYDFTIQKMAGIGYGLPINRNQIYRIEVQTGTHESYVFDLNPTIAAEKETPILKSKFGDKTVTVEWETNPFKEDFYGYYLEISMDGKDFENVSEMPYINTFDTKVDNPDLYDLVQEIDLPTNYKTFWIRLRGMDYFGKKSLKYSEIKGNSYEIIDASPAIIHADQTAKNEAELRWKLGNNWNRLIDHFELFRADSLEGEFVSVKDDIEPNAREIKFPMTEKRNYFSIGIVPKDGDVIRGFPVFVMGQDTVPPITPQNFAGTIDSLGIVTLTWSANTEDDLWGYKIFRSEFIEDEFGNLNASPIRDTTLKDTINLNNINEQIHYSMIALDKRNNRSPFTEIITLQRPDTIPPTRPLVRNVKFLEDSILINWAASSSDDVILHQLFRKEIDKEGWKLITEFDEVEPINDFVDKAIEVNKIYAYTIRAKDDANLISPLAKPYMIQTKSKKAIDVFEEIETTYDEITNISTISWAVKEDLELHEIIVYRGKRKDKIQLFEIIKPEARQISQKVKEDEQWFYIFDPILKSDTLTKMSGVIKVKAL